MSEPLYVVVKLISGEQILATLEAEDAQFVNLELPIVIRTIINPEMDRESVSAAPFCAFSDSTNFVIEKSHILFIKRLHQTFVPHYKKFIKIYDQVVFKDNNYFDELDEPAEEVTSEEELPFTFVEGNDTKH